MIPGKKYQLEDILQIAWRRKWLIAVPLVLVSLGTALVSRTLPDMYRSETLIMVVPQRVPESYVRSTIVSRIEDRLQTLRQQILSRSRLERIVVDLNLYPEARRTGATEALVQRMRQAITIEIVKGDSFSISYVSQDPVSAKIVTERLASLFIEENVRDREGLAVGTSQFLETQLDDARRRLIEQEKKLEAYRLRYSSELPSQAPSNLQASQNAQTQLDEMNDSINRDRDRRLMLERQIAELSEPPPPSVAPAASAGSSSIAAGEDVLLNGESAADQLVAARNKLRALELRLKPDHPDMVRMRRLVAELERKAETESRTPSSPASEQVRLMTSAEAARHERLVAAKADMDKVDRDLALKQAEQKRLRAAIATYQARLEAAPIRESELIELTRDYETLQQIYRNLLAKREDSKIAANLERNQAGEQFRVLDPPRVPEKPFSPNRPQINLLGALAGLSLGVGLAALLEYRDSSLKTDEDVRTFLALPVLAAIPVLAPKKLSTGAKGKWVLSVTAAAAAVAVVMLVWKLAWN